VLLLREVRSQRLISRLLRDVERPIRGHMESHITTHPEILRGIDGAPPVYVSAAGLNTPEAAIAYVYGLGELDDPNVSATRVLMRELDPIACKIRGVDEGRWVECTPRAKQARAFWRIDG